MAVTVSSDLSINISEDPNKKKLSDKQDLLRESLHKGEPKAMGVSQVMLGFMVICYSVPLLSHGVGTELIRFGVPWWSGLSFIAAGVFTLVMEKRNSIQLVFTCLVITMLAAFISIIALIFYVVDFLKNQETPCHSESEYLCHEIHFISMFNNEMKSILFFLNIAQTGISSAFAYMLYNERKRFINYVIVH